MMGAGLAGVYKKAAVFRNIPGSDMMFDDEVHYPLAMPDGKRHMANYMGPGTQVKKRLLRGDEGLTEM